jgi:hypothetical protein
MLKLEKSAELSAISLSLDRCEAAVEKLQDILADSAEDSVALAESDASADAGIIVESDGKALLDAGDAVAA